MMSFSKKHIGLIVFTVLMFGPLAIVAQDASFYVSPAQGNYSVGQTFSVKVMVDTDAAAINAAQATLSFPTDKLKISSVSKTSSIFSLWVQDPAYSNTQGTLDFGGGLPSPGFAGRGQVLNISFLTKATGQAEISFSQEKILANNARGTNIFSTSLGGSYYIGEAKVAPPKPNLPAAPKISSSSHPQATKWYNNNNPEFQWEVGSGIIGVSTAFNKKFLFDPGTESEGKFDSKNYQGVEDGIWYLHVRFENEEGWGEIAHREVRIDTTPPNPFEIQVDNEGDPTNPQLLLYFKAEDETSGVSHYKVKIGEADVFTLLDSQVNPYYRMPLQAPGDYLIKVEAVDNTGNAVSASTELKIESIPIPEITVYPNTFSPVEETLHLEGIAMPGYEVLVFFTKDGKVIKQWETMSDGKGSWSVDEEDLFRSGNYIVYAKARDARGAVSDPSLPRSIKVILNGLAIGLWIISYSWIIFFLLIIFLALLFFLLFFWRKNKKEEEKRAREIEDLRQKFYKEYNELKAGMIKELELFKQAKEKRELSKEEKQRHQQLLKDLFDIERVFAEELKDVEEIK
ncbi:MAG: cohesin domain-containing protein [bacterium]